MVLFARLHIEGHPKENDGLPLISCSFSFDQDIDARGLPISSVRGGVINISMVSADDPDIVNWMFMSEADKNGKIVFASTETTSPFKTLEFKNGRLIHYDEIFSRDNEMVMTLTISSRQISISGAQHENVWTGYDSE